MKKLKQFYKDPQNLLPSLARREVGGKATQACMMCSLLPPLFPAWSCTAQCWLFHEQTKLVYPAARLGLKDPGCNSISLYNAFYLTQSKHLSRSKDIFLVVGLLCKETGERENQDKNNRIFPHGTHRPSHSHVCSGTMECIFFFVVLRCDVPNIFDTWRGSFF